MEIRKVVTKKELNDFIKLPYELYKNYELWVPPLLSDQKKFFNPEKNPYYRHSEVQLFLAYKDGKPVGRISAQTNTQHNNFHNDKVGFFGFFESIDDEEVANGLLKAAEDWNKNKGMDTLRGPMNFSVNNECGTLVDGFETPPYIMMTHNFSYYDALIKKSGYKKSMDLLAYLLKADPIPPKLERVGKLAIKKNSFEIRCLDKKNLKRDIELVFEIYSKAWEKNWGFVPDTREEFDQTVKDLLPVVDSELVYLAFADGKPVGFSVALPNFNFVLKKMNGHMNPVSLAKALYYKSKIPTVRVITMGVVHEYQKRGIDAAFYYKTFETCRKKGFWGGELSWILETNLMMNRIAEMLGADPYKRYRIYDKEI